MKSDLVDVNQTRKDLRVEIPTDIVNAEIDRITRDYSRKAKIPGFRPGKAPATVIKRRFRDQILHDVAHDLIPRAVDDALRERGVEAVDTPDIRDVNVDENQPLTFTASFDTVPPFDPGDLTTISLRRPAGRVEDEAVGQALDRLRQRAARYDTVEARALADGDVAVVDLERKGPDDPKPDKHADVTVELGSKVNPPGFDKQLLGLEIGQTKSFTIHYPNDYEVSELANTDVHYTATVKGIKRRVVPELDDEFAKDLGEFDTLEALRTRVRGDLEHEARHTAEHEVRSQLTKELAARLPFEVPTSMVDRELEHRVEEFVRRLVEQQIDPRKAGIDWQAFRDSQHEVAREAVASALVLDEIARRESLQVTEEEVSSEIGRYAERTGRTPPVIRAALEKEGGLSRIQAGLRRQKAIDFAMSRATIAED